MPRTPDDQVNDLLREVWPEVDPELISRSAQRYKAVAQRLLEVQRAIVTTADALAGGLDGRTGTAQSERAAVIAEKAATAANLAGAGSDLAARYSAAVAITQERQTVAGAIAARDLHEAELMVATTGDTTASIGAANAAATVLAAVAGELDTRTRLLTDDALARSEAVDHDDQGQSAGSSAASPMLPGAMMGAGTALAAAGAGTRPGHLHVDRDVAAKDLSMLHARAAHLTAMQPPEVAPWIRLAVGLGQNHDGRRIVVVGTSEPGGYLRPGTVPETNEVVVGDGRSPELVIVDYFTERDLIPMAVCTTTPAAPEVRAQLADAGVTTSHGADEGTSEEGDAG